MLIALWRVRKASGPGFPNWPELPNESVIVTDAPGFRLIDMPDSAVKTFASAVKAPITVDAPAMSGWYLTHDEFIFVDVRGRAHRGIAKLRDLLLDELPPDLVLKHIGSVIEEQLGFEGSVMEVLSVFSRKWFMLPARITEDTIEVMDTASGDFKIEFSVQKGGSGEH